MLHRNSLGLTSDVIHGSDVTNVPGAVSCKIGLSGVDLLGMVAIGSGVEVPLPLSNSARSIFLSICRSTYKIGNDGG